MRSSVELSAVHAEQIQLPGDDCARTSPTWAAFPPSPFSLPTRIRAQASRLALARERKIGVAGHVEAGVLAPPGLTQTLTTLMLAGAKVSPVSRWCGHRPRMTANLSPAPPPMSRRRTLGPPALLGPVRAARRINHLFQRRLVVLKVWRR